ncbi:MAG: hypothetical protein Q8O76_09615, partial [Chloroflexota bacterium]|nr:hypothetical protein [Chloroflexota bacterium]
MDLRRGAVAEAIRRAVEATPSAGTPVINLVRRAPRGLALARGQGLSGGGSKLGVFPASFDPLTKAHLAIIREARKAGLDEILLLVDKINADKMSFGASLEDRLLLVCHFFKDDADISIGLSSHGLFREKLHALKRLYSPATRTWFLVGYDTMLRVLDRKYYRDGEVALDQLFAEGEFLVAGRGHEGEKDIMALFAREENKRFRNG